MALDYSKLPDYFWEDFKTKRENQKNFILDEIKLRLQLLDEKRKKISALQYEEKLLTNDIYDVIREDVTRDEALNVFWGLNVGDLLWKAWSADVNIEKDPDKQKEYEQCLEFVKQRIADKIFKRDPEFHFHGLIQFNFGERYEFHYEYKGFHFELNIPVYEKLKYEDALRGYYLQYYKRPSVTTYDIATMDYATIYDQFIELYNKKYKDLPNFYPERDE